MSEIAQRLKSVSNGAPTQEFTLRRNQLGQLGFHVQHDGLITELENFGYAWQTGLRQGSRIVEVKAPSGWRIEKTFCSQMTSHAGTSYALFVCTNRDNLKAIGLLSLA